MSMLKIVPDHHMNADAPASQAEVDESLADIMDLVARLQERTSQHATLCATDGPSWPENEAALHWMNTALEDIEATVRGISVSAEQSGALIGRATP